ncbi:hypothetical protein GCM10017712_09550 [Curtobacterium citreum]
MSLDVDALLVAEQPARVTTAAAARARPARVRVCCTGCAFRVLWGGVLRVRFGRAGGGGAAFWTIVDGAGFRAVLRW